MKKLQYLLTLFGTVLVTSLSMSGVALAQAQPQTQAPQQTTTSTTQTQSNSAATEPINSDIANSVCKGVLSTETGTISPDTTVQDCEKTGDGSFGFLVQRIINIFSVVVGAVSVIMIIIGGFRYIISGGDSNGVGAAKNTILYAIVGLVIVIFAQLIVRFILTSVTPIAG